MKEKRACFPFIRLPSQGRENALVIRAEGNHVVRAANTEGFVQTSKDAQNASAAGKRHVLKRAFISVLSSFSIVWVSLSWSLCGKFSLITVKQHPDHLQGRLKAKQHVIQTNFMSLKAFLSSFVLCCFPLERIITPSFWNVAAGGTSPTFSKIL